MGATSQLIWARQHTGINQRLRLIDDLQQNLERERPLYGPNMEVTRLIIFKGDPRDGAPKEAAP